jgi:hypothetical protein
VRVLYSSALRGQTQPHRKGVGNRVRRGIASQPSKASPATSDGVAGRRVGPSIVAGRAIHGSGDPRVGPSTGRAIHCCTRPQRAPQVIIKTRLMTHQPNWRGLPAPWMSDNGWPWSPRRDLMSVLHRIETIAGPGFHAGPHNQSAAGRVVEDGKAGDSNVSLGPFGFEKTQRLSYGEQGVSRWRTGSRVTV